MLDSHLNVELLFSCGGETIDVTFSAAKELNFDTLSHLILHQALRWFTLALLIEIY